MVLIVQFCQFNCLELFILAFHFLNYDFAFSLTHNPYGLPIILHKNLNLWFIKVLVDPVISALDYQIWQKTIF